MIKCGCHRPIRWHQNPQPVAFSAISPISCFSPPPCLVPGQISCASNALPPTPTPTPITSPPLREPEAPSILPPFLGLRYLSLGFYNGSLEQLCRREDGKHAPLLRRFVLVEFCVQGRLNAAAPSWVFEKEGTFPKGRR